jgi:hypothetical protein
MRAIVLLALVLVSSIFIPSLCSSQQAEKIIRAEDILVKIETGAPVDYDNVIIQGNLNVSDLELPIKYRELSEFEQSIDYLSTDAKYIDSAININHSEINGSIYCDNIIFNKTIVFRGCIFDRDVHFRGTQFRDGASFQNARFAGNAFLEWAEFCGTADFENSIFYNSAHFLEVVFLNYSKFMKVEFRNFVDMRGAKHIGPANFASSIFGNDAYFNKIHFSNDIDFRNVRFYGFASFWESNFEGDADFRGTEFHGQATFPNSQFKGIIRLDDVKFDSLADFRKSVFLNDALFWNSLFKEKADFRDAIFEKNVDFENAIMNAKADFSHVHFSNDRNFLARFLNTSFLGDVSFDYSSFSPITDMRNSDFNGSLNMTHAIFDRIEIRWNDMKDKLVCDESVYLALINNFKNLGQFKDADDCTYQYGKYRLGNFDSGWSRIEDTISWITCGFGVRPYFIIVWAFLFTFLFGCLYYFSGALEREAQTQVNQTKKLGEKTNLASFPEALYFSATVFLVALGPQGLRPADQWRYVVMLEDILGWILMTLFVVTLGHVLIR